MTRDKKFSVLCIKSTSPPAGGRSDLTAARERVARTAISVCLIVKAVLIDGAEARDFIGHHIDPHHPFAVGDLMGYRYFVAKFRVKQFISTGFAIYNQPHNENWAAHSKIESRFQIGSYLPNLGIPRWSNHRGEWANIQIGERGFSVRLLSNIVFKVKADDHRWCLPRIYELNPSNIATLDNFTLNT